MNHLSVTLRAASFQPGEVLIGDAEWDLTEPLPSHLELKLCWTTDGNLGGGAEPVVTNRVPLEIGPPVGTRQFQFDLPQGPWSFRGKLFEIVWYVELATDDNDYQRAEFILGPGGKPIEVAPPESPR